MKQWCFTLTVCCSVQLEQSDWQENIDSIMAEFEKEYGRQPLYTICFY